MSQSRWYNQVGENAAQAGSQQLEQTLKPDNSQAIAQGLQAALQVGGAIKANREASGAAEARRQRIAACGRKPLVGFGRRFRQRKEEYNKCVADAGKSLAGAKSNEPSGNEYQPEQNSSNMTFVYVGLGLLVVGTAAYFILKKK
jgi:hypothetical protein